MARGTPRGRSNMPDLPPQARKQAKIVFATQGNRPTAWKVANPQEALERQTDDCYEDDVIVNTDTDPRDPE